MNNGHNLIETCFLFSDKLRRALNLSPDDYPPYIRRMVIHGYPPGYRLLETESYIAMIDGELADLRCNKEWQKARHGKAGQKPRDTVILVMCVL